MQLKRQGFEIVTTNYRSKYGEIDIIAREGGDLVFVEVRSRRTDELVYPGESVDRRKQSKIVRTAQHYLAANNLDVDCRFDVAEVRFERGKPVSVKLIKAAFGED